MPEKKSLEEVKRVIEAKGCKLVSGEYKSNKIPLKIIMRCGHESEVRFDLFITSLKTFMCRRCSELDKCKYSLDDVKKYLADNGCQFIKSSTEYVNTKS